MFLDYPNNPTGVEFISLSKTFNMAGWRIGAVVGHRDVIAAINLLQEHYYVSLPPRSSSGRRSRP
jgi:aspartate/methionine/tyrosine aminotransferase